MSHEIRTPLNAILGFVAHLAKSEEDAGRLKEFELIKSSGRNLLTVINDILDFSKIESGKIDIERYPHNVREVCHATVETFRDVARQKHITLLSTIDESVPECILCDEVRLRQVMFNLLGNAMKFSSAGGRIAVEVRFEDDRLYCAVQDSGIGIAADKLKRIFNAFDQEDTSTTRKFGGTGLGLSISSRLVELMGGELDVSSTRREPLLLRHRRAAVPAPSQSRRTCQIGRGDGPAVGARADGRGHPDEPDAHGDHPR